VGFDGYDLIVYGTVIAVLIIFLLSRSPAYVKKAEWM
jgi:hypothetical protein